MCEGCQSKTFEYTSQIKEDSSSSAAAAPDEEEVIVY